MKKYLLLLFIALLTQCFNSCQQKGIKEFHNGNSLTYNGNYNEAIIQYTKCLELNPKYAPAYNNRGNCYAKIGNYTKALNDYKTTIKIDPSDPDAYFNKGKLEAQHGNEEQCMKDITVAAYLGHKAAKHILKEQYLKAIDQINMDEHEKKEKKKKWEELFDKEFKK